MKTIAVIPALNEFEHLQKVVAGVLNFVDQVIIIDDGSRRPLMEPRNNPRVHIIRHRINLGKGAAMKTGVTAALQMQADIVVFLDADGQHLPEEIPDLLKPLKEHRADIVFGVRKFHAAMPFVAKLGNIFLSRTLQALFGIGITDTQSGFRAFNTKIFKSIEWNSARYSVETEMIVNVGKQNITWTTVPISTVYTDKYRGTTVIDGIRIFINMLFWKIR